MGDVPLENVVGAQDDFAESQAKWRESLSPFDKDSDTGRDLNAKAGGLLRGAGEMVGVPTDKVLFDLTRLLRGERAGAEARQYAKSLKEDADTSTVSAISEGAGMIGAGLVAPEAGAQKIGAAAAGGVGRIAKAMAPSGGRIAKYLVPAAEGAARNAVDMAGAQAIQSANEQVLDNGHISHEKVLAAAGNNLGLNSALGFGGGALAPVATEAMSGIGRAMVDREAGAGIPSGLKRYLAKGTKLGDWMERTKSEQTLQAMGVNSERAGDILDNDGQLMEHHKSLVDLIGEVRGTPKGKNPLEGMTADDEFAISRTANHRRANSAAVFHDEVGVAADGTAVGAPKAADIIKAVEDSAQDAIRGNSYGSRSGSAANAADRVADTFADNVEGYKLTDKQWAEADAMRPGKPEPPEPIVVTKPDIQAWEAPPPIPGAKEHNQAFQAAAAKAERRSATEVRDAGSEYRTASREAEAANRLAQKEHQVELAKSSAEFRNSGEDQARQLLNLQPKSEITFTGANYKALQDGLSEIGGKNVDGAEFRHIVTSSVHDKYTEHLAAMSKQLPEDWASKYSAVTRDKAVAAEWAKATLNRESAQALSGMGKSWGSPVARTVGGVGGAAGYAAGGPLGGAVGYAGGKAVGSMLDRAIKRKAPYLLPNALQSIETWANAGAATQAVDRSIHRAVVGFLERSAPSSRTSVRGASILNDLWGDVPRRDRDQAVQDHVDQMQQLGANQAAQRAHVDTIVGDLSNHAPDLAAGVAAAAALKLKLAIEHLPKGSAGRSLFNNTRKYTDSELQDYEQYALTLDDPHYALDAMEHGRLTRNHVAALRDGNPEIYAEIRNQLISQVSAAKTPPDYSKIVQLSLMMGQPLDASLEQDFTDAVQQTFKAGHDQKQEGSQGGGTSPSTGLSKSSATPMQRIEGR